MYTPHHTVIYREWKNDRKTKVVLYKLSISSYFRVMAKYNNLDRFVLGQIMLTLKDDLKIYFSEQVTHYFLITFSNCISIIVIKCNVI